MSLTLARQKIGQSSLQENLLDGFEEFYKRYPQKKSVGDARKAWQTKKCAKRLDEIMQDLKMREEQDDRWKRGNQSVPYPATYLRQEKYRDEEKILPRFDKPNRQADDEKKAAALLAELKAKREMENQ